MRFATMTSARKSMPFVRSPYCAFAMPPTLLRAIFSFAISTAMGSISTPSTSEAPRSAPATDKIPEPQPTSRTFAPGFTYSSMRRMQSEVVSCVPVPKAIPGSISMIFSPCFGSYSSQVGFTTIVFPTFAGLKYSFQLSFHSLSSSTCTEISRAPRSISSPNSPACALAFSCRIACLISFSFALPSSFSSTKTVTFGVSFSISKTLSSI